MDPDYYSTVSCYLDAPRAQVEDWMDTITDLGDGLAPPNMYDIDFSASLGVEVREISVHAAHTAAHPRDSTEAEVWVAYSSAAAHALRLFNGTGALDHLLVMSVEITRGLGREEVRLLASRTNALCIGSDAPDS